ncbi:MAG: hypothetical protein Q8Q48_00865 [Candidatus Staskawiczbacteria bacterium]|nr:hypothetical protein [Candidatus Staskawiczbacteria bacterium]
MGDSSVTKWARRMFMLFNILAVFCRTAKNRYYSALFLVIIKVKINIIEL